MTFVKGRSKRVFEVPDSIGESMVASGHVKRATEAEFRKQRKAVPAPAPPAEPETEEQEQTESADAAPVAPADGDAEETPASETEEAAGATSDGAAVEPPAGNASTEAWREFALAQGYSEEQLDGLGRDEIKSLIG